IAATARGPRVPPRLRGGALAALAAGFWLLAPATSHAARPAALDSLLAAERAFSALSAAKGIKPAFLAYLAEDAIIFRPTATNGPKAVANQLPSTNVLVWEPDYAELSAAGDLGVTSGPWELLHVDPQRPPLGYGHFVSVWKKQKSGHWRVAVDIGTEHEKPEHGVGNTTLTRGPEPTPGSKGGNADLQGLDRDLGNKMKGGGIGGGYDAMATTDLRFYRDNMLPLAGLDDVRSVVGKMPGYFDYRPEGERVANSRDLGCTWGQAAQHAPGATAADSCVYVHVWRKGADKRWKLALEVLNPLRRK
ncbi:MAG TPA: nuclear transport factor 2 family protein, partial [Gaiellales bacterium]|nr:nuclear transport factor 2 family protein [Gaiellales bacterium]